MASNLSNSDDDIISGINVTPLVDVILVLLVIFLITAPVKPLSAMKLLKGTTGTWTLQASSGCWRLNGPKRFTMDTAEWSSLRMTPPPRRKPKR